jgi:hypothetical protein
MEVRNDFFRLVVGLSAFALGIGVYFIWQSSPAETVTAVPNAVKPIAESSPIFVPLPPPLETAVENDAEPADEFYPDGDYYLMGDLPKGFKDIDYLSITANKYEIEKDGTSYWKQILPEGHIFTKTKFKFSRIFINSREISFETKTIKGISYKFIGNFPEELILTEKEEDYIYGSTGNLMGPHQN